MDQYRQPRVRTARPMLGVAYVRDPHSRVMHAIRRENDEIACSCGKRWPVGEEHP